MTKVIGLTGGIGSGKTTVSKMFESVGVPVYNADLEAKKLMQSSFELKQKIKQLIGNQAYNGNQINKAFISKNIFNNPKLLAKMNALVHPEVAKHYKHWLSKQSAIYVVKEVAILFEIGAEDEFDYILTVTAPESLCIQRVIQRDQTTEKGIRAIMSNQLDTSVKVLKSDFVIHNIDIENSLKQVYEIHNEIHKANSQL